MAVSNSFTDEELAVLLSQGDRVAFTLIYNRYFQVLYIHAYHKLSDSQEAQDIVHELFAQLWAKHQELNIQQSLQSYLYASIRNKILDHFAKKDVRNKYLQSLDGFLQQNYCVTDHRIREKQLNALIEKGITSLPDKMRTVFEMSRQQALSHKEIAQQLNLSENTVKKQINNALRILRSKIGLLFTL